MALNYSTIKTTLDEISGRIVADTKRLQQAKIQVSTAKADLAAMATAYGAFVAALDADAAAAPGDNLLALSKDEKDKLVSEFSALQTVATNMDADLSTYVV